MSPDLRAEAAAALAAMDAAESVAPPSRVRQWLIDLAPLVAGVMTLEDARQRVDALAVSLDYPEACFTPASLRKAARRFTFFPGYKELCDVLDDHRTELRVRRQRLAAIVQADGQAGPAAAGRKRPPSPAPSPAPSPIDRSAPAQDRVRRILAEAGIALRRPGTGPGRPTADGPGDRHQPAAMS